MSSSTVHAEPLYYFCYKIGIEYTLKILLCAISPATSRLYSECMLSFELEGGGGNWARSLYLVTVSLRLWEFILVIPGMHTDKVQVGLILASLLTHSYSSSLNSDMNKTPPIPLQSCAMILLVCLRAVST